jgi:hypothetical protein
MHGKQFFYLAFLAALLVGCGDVVSQDDATTSNDGASSGGADGTTPVVDAVETIDIIVIDAPPCPEEPCANGLSCTASSGCVSGNCECVDPGCTTRVCAPDDCVCGYGADGTCSTPMTGGSSDPEDCGDSNGCFAGQCKRLDGQACTGDAECGGGQCECIDSTGTTRVCASSDCVCRYGTAGACTATLDSGSADPEDCSGTNACFAGECKKVVGQSCAANTECGSGQCECVNASCSTRVCAASSCTCGYGAGGSCGSQMSNGADDPEDCDAASQSCYAGACRAENLGIGSTCYDDRQCAGGNCECRDSTCSARWCAGVSCVCRYNGTASATSCASTFILNDYSDPQDCAGLMGCGLSGFDSRHCACNGSGACVIKEPVIIP